MKRIYELSEKEVLALTSQEVQDFIQVEKVLAGVKLEVEGITQDLVELPKPIKKLYKVGIFGDKLVFDDLAIAQKLIDQIASLKKPCHVSNEYDKSYTSFLYPEDGVGSQSYNNWDTIEPILVYASKEQATEARNISDSNKRINDYNTELASASQRYYEQSTAMAQEVYTFYNDIIDKYIKMDRLKQIFTDKYLPISNGDAEMAIEFMSVAYLLDEESKEYILSK